MDESRVEHTSGPWRVEAWDYNLATPPYSKLVIQNDEHAICEVWTSYHGGDIDKAEAHKAANARLIATAPELLASLESLAELVRLLAPTEDDAQRIGWQYPADLDAPEQIIARARGGE